MIDASEFTAKRKWGEAVAAVSTWFKRQFSHSVIPDGVYDVPSGAGGKLTRVLVKRHKAVRIGDMTPPPDERARHTPFAFPEEGEPGPDEVLTLDEMIEWLEDIRQNVDGNTEVRMYDGEQVCMLLISDAFASLEVSMFLPDDCEPSPPWVVVAARFGPGDREKRRERRRRSRRRKAAAARASGGQGGRNLPDEPPGGGR